MKVLKFWAERCWPCKAYKPHFKEFVSQVNVAYEEIDVDAQQDITKQYNISSIPCTIFIKDDIVVAREVWALQTDKLLSIYTSLL